VLATNVERSDPGLIGINALLTTAATISASRIPLLIARVHGW
jgi:hypothetical protein